MSRTDDIKKRLDEATPGPWSHKAKNDQNYVSVAGRTLAKLWRDRLFYTEYPSHVNTDGETVTVLSKDKAREAGLRVPTEAEQAAIVATETANSTFIANAPSDIKYLLEQNTRLREALEAIGDDDGQIPHHALAKIARNALEAEQ